MRRTPVPTAAIRAPRSPATTHRAAIAAWLMGGLIATGVVLVAAASIDVDDAPPGTTVGGLRVDGLDRSRLASALTAATQPPAVVVHAGRHNVTLPLANVGVSVDVDATVRHVLHVRRWRQWTAALGVATSAREVRPVIRKDEAQLAQAITKVQQVAGRGSAGDLRLSGGQLALVRPVAGEHVDALAARRALVSLFASLPVAGSVTLRGTSDATAPVTNAEALARRARGVVRHGIQLRALTTTVTVGGTDIAPHLTLAGNPLRLRLRPSFLTVAATAARALTSARPELNTPTPGVLLTAQGDVRWHPRRLRRPVSLDASQQVLPDDVFRAVDAWLVDGSGHGVIDVGQHAAGSESPQVDAVLGSFTTFFPCCEPRVTNITTIGHALDGTVVPAGSTFSLNGAIGRRTADKGYVLAPTIVGGRLVDTVGGGISQFATTMFNAAYFGSMTLDAHMAHSFYISRYPPGREATVDYPSIDLRWTNTSGAPIVVRTRVTATSLTVALYGHDRGAWVESHTSPWTPFANGGFRVPVTRTIHDRDGGVHEEMFLTTYAPSPE